MLLQLNNWMISRYREGGLCVIVVDEAQDLTWGLLEEIRLLTNLETSSDKLLQIVLSGQPELESRLRDPRVRQLRQRVSVWCKTKPLSAEQTPLYISERLRIAAYRIHCSCPRHCSWSINIHKEYLVLSISFASTH